MRTLIKSTITKDDAIKIIKRETPLSFDNPIIQKILKKVYQYTSIENPSQPSYISLGGHGHKWHTDTGSDGHMEWCRFGLSTLLTPPSSDACFLYKSPKASYNQEEHYLNTILHTSDEEHMVEHCDNRKTLLIFLA